MELYQFNENLGKKITRYNSNFSMSRIMQSEKKTHIGYMYLEESSLIGYHQAPIPQLLLITTGEGYVRGEGEECFKVKAGDAVFWGKDEWHETKTDSGLTALVIESEELNPESFMPLKK